MTNEYLDLAAAVRAQTGKSIAVQMREILRLRKLKQQLGVSDYYLFRLYDEQHLRDCEARDFIGWKLNEAYSAALNPRTEVLPAWDKLTFKSIADSFGLPALPIVATYRDCEYLAPSVFGHHLKTKDELLVFLRDPDNYPLFCKPSFSQQGIGAYRIESYRADDDTIEHFGGEPEPAGDFAERVAGQDSRRFVKHNRGYLFQRPAAQHPEITAFTGYPVLSSVRVVCLNDGGDAFVQNALWKCALPPNHTDNFSKGKTGNLVADVDVSNGRLYDAMNALWPYGEWVTEQPSTGRKFRDFHLPDWDRIVEICMQGAKAISGMGVLHWDIAMTDSGPQIMELNDIGGIEGLQIGGRGMLAGRARQFFKDHGDRSRHPWINQL